MHPVKYTGLVVLTLEDFNMRVISMHYMKKLQLHHILHCLILIVSIALSSCGYISDKPPANIDVFKANQLDTCKIDINKLSEILIADQKEQIRCLEENFNQFTKYVRTQDAGSISEMELNSFIKKFFLVQSDSIVKGLSLIFQLNMLLLKDEASKISRNNISPLFQLLIKVNQEAIVITSILKEMDSDTSEANFWFLREKFKESVTRFSNGVLEITKGSKGSGQKLNIQDFISEASKKIGSKEINPETINSLLFLKSILVGGPKEIITSDELMMLINKLPKILTLSFDLYFAKKRNFPTDAQESRFYVTNIHDIYKIIQFNQNNFQLFTIDQLLKLAGSFVTDKNLKKIKPSVEQLKGKIFGGNKESFSLLDIKNSLIILKDILERNYFNIVAYKAHQYTLSKINPIIYLEQPDLPVLYDIFSFKRTTELHRDFENTAINVRYFRDDQEGVPHYGAEFKRNKKGFLEVSFLNWVSTKLFKAYGHINSSNQMQVSLTEFQTLLNDLKTILIELELWSPAPETFARNAVFLADLFQNKSNGNFEVDVLEATEYIQMILSSVTVTNKLMTELSSICNGGINAETPVFATECFNQHFFDSILNKLKLKTFFPRLNNYINNSTRHEVIDYLKGVEGFARDLPNPELPINKRDAILIIGSILNIESTFIRFDTNKDNILDYSELLGAFGVYKLSIISMAKLKDEEYALSIFLYMISKMEIPPNGTWMNNAKFYSFHKCVTNDFCRETFLYKIEAKRLNIGKLLYYIVMPSEVFANKPREQLTLKNELSSHF
jgi:hypothetical protein